jgi:formylglycine-generating enzyme required for sulfatase activity
LLLIEGFTYKVVKQGGFLFVSIWPSSLSKKIAKDVCMIVYRKSLGASTFRVALVFLLIIFSVGDRKLLIAEPNKQDQENKPKAQSEASVESRSNAIGDINRTRTGKEMEAGQNSLLLQRLNFDFVTVDSVGKVSELHKGQAQFYVEKLENGVTLETVEIPGGKFLMGTLNAEAEQVSTEYRRYFSSEAKEWGERYVPQQMPQHTVAVTTFFMGKFEVTQAQWKAVSRLPKVNLDLISEPSLFKGNNLPVEEVSWEEAVEFCVRLTRLTGRQYRLPSEAEWEYACRAGTTTQFSFGNTITPELVNYNADYPYGLASEGVYRRKTTPVGSFGVANGFGLYDMHGNVEEWCLDAWHENYNGAPSDGSAWELNEHSGYRVVRGGSWLHLAAYCRAAFRQECWQQGNRSYFRGFRIVAG